MRTSIRELTDEEKQLLREAPRNYKEQSTCPDCEGTGAQRYPCRFCEGTGQFTKGKEPRECRSCGGTGLFFPTWKGYEPSSTRRFLPYVKFTHPVTGEEFKAYRCKRCKGQGTIAAFRNTIPQEPTQFTSKIKTEARGDSLS